MTTAGREEKGLMHLTITQGHRLAVESNSQGFSHKPFSWGPKVAGNFRCWSCPGGAGGYGHPEQLTWGRRDRRSLTHCSGQARLLSHFLAALVSLSLEHGAALLPKGCPMGEMQLDSKEVTLLRRCCTSPGKQSCC